MVNNPLIRPFFLGGGGIGGWVPLDSHETKLQDDSIPFGAKGFFSEGKLAVSFFWECKFQFAR